MASERIGYVRVSTTDQGTERQLAGVKVDQVFTDKASGKDTERPSLTEALRHVRRGDTLVVHSMDRLARNILDLHRIVDDLTGRGVAVEFVKERRTYSGSSDPMDRLMLGILGSIAEFERALIRERQAEGIAIAKARKAYKGRAKKLTPQQAKELREAKAKGASVVSLAGRFGVSRETVYQYLR